MTRARLLRLGVLVWLTFVYVWLWGDPSFGNFLAGLVIGLLIMILLPLPRVPVQGRVHPLSLIVLLAVVVYYALESSVQVAWFAIRPGAPPVTGVLRYRFHIESDLVLVLCTDVINLIPGTMVLEIDTDRRVIYVHVLDVSSDEAVNKFYRSTRLIERLFIASFEREIDWASEATGEQ